MVALRTTFFCAMWLAVIAAGQYVMFRYEWQAASTLEADGAWPREASLVHDGRRPTLVVFMHPQCPCSRASLVELTAILSRSKGRVACTVVFVRPSNFDEGWERTDLWKTAERLAGVKVEVDSSGEQARLFKARASGEAFLYDAAGRLLFHGGMTGSRGHEGDNPSRQAIVACIESGIAAREQSEVYGCGLLDD
jgi:hypothetical protein